MTFERVRSMGVISFTLAVVLVFPACDQTPPLVEDTRETGISAATSSGDAASGAATPPTPRAPLPEPTVAALAAVGSGTYRSPFAPDDAPVTTVAAFRLAVRQVTNAEFLAFVRARPEWRRDRVARLQADEGYLAHWSGPDSLGADAPADAPVTHVSWFAARAYARLHALRLPKQAEWELAAAASATVADARRDPAFRQQILDWYARPNPARLPAAGSGPANLWGLRDLHGLVWEWVDDFDAALLDGDLRGSALDDAVCGAGAVGAEDATDYGTFMRFAMRAALRGAYTTSSLGFRVAADAADAAHESSRAGGCCSGAAPAQDAVAPNTPGASVYQLGLSLRDAQGATIPLDLRRGSPVIISMFYGTCPAACPLLIEDLQALERELSERARAKVRVVLVSFDPARDGPAVLAGLAERHGVDHARWTLASADDARELGAALGIRYRARAQDGGFDHTSSLVILDRDGVEVARVDGLGGATVGALAALRRLTEEAQE